MCRLSLDTYPCIQIHQNRNNIDETTLSSKFVAYKDLDVRFDNPWFLNSFLRTQGVDFDSKNYSFVKFMEAQKHAYPMLEHQLLLWSVGTACYTNEGGTHVTGEASHCENQKKIICSLMLILNCRTGWPPGGKLFWGCSNVFASACWRHCQSRVFFGLLVSPVISGAWFWYVCVKVMPAYFVTEACAANRPFAMLWLGASRNGMHDFESAHLWSLESVWNLF